LGEELDVHRKRVQSQHPGLSLTAMYNVLETLCVGRAVTPKETATHHAGLSPSSASSTTNSIPPSPPPTAGSATVAPKPT
jgi:hypothetical protein